MRVRNLSCPYCKKRTTRDKMVNHIEYNHSDQLPEGFTPLRMTFHVANNKPIEYRRPCRVCGNPTEWDENKGRYNLLCSNPVCKEKYVAKMKASMGDKYGAYRPTATAEGLEKMLAARRISGKYKWSDGTVFDYTGSYELETLKFMDGGLNIKSEDLVVPGPVLEYEYNGQKHLYITDMYYRPYNLIIEVKDGGKSINKNKEYAETRAKQMAKEKHVIQNTDYNYIRLTDKDMGQLMAVLADLKYHFVEKDPDRVIHVNENMKHGEIFNCEYLEESDKKFNLELLDENSDNNILWLSGLTGSGKSTLGKDLAENFGFEYICLDDVSKFYVDNHSEQYIEQKFVSNLRKYCSDSIIYLENHPRSTYDSSTPIAKTHDLQKSFCDWFIETHKANGKLYVIESDIIIGTYPIEWFADKPVVIKSNDYEVFCDRRTSRSFLFKEGVDQSDKYDKSLRMNIKNSKLKALYDYYVEFCDKLQDLVVEKQNRKHEFDLNSIMESTPMGAIVPMVGFNPEKDVVIVNYMKKKTFVDDSDYAICDSPKFDTVYIRDKDGILKKKDKVALLGSYYTPYIIRGRRESIVEALYENKDKFVNKTFIYETAFGHPMYSKDQLKYEAVEEYTDYYQDLEDIRESFNFIEESAHNQEISEPYFITAKDGSINACIMHKEFSKPMRARSSMLILKQISGKTHVFLQKDKKGEFHAPGGGWNKSESPMDAAIREAQEEARINVSHIKYCGTLIEYHEDVADWVRDNVENENDWWYGYYSKIYVGMYDSEFTGKVKKEDEDIIGKEGKFYPYDEIVDELPSAYAEAINIYLTDNYLEEAATEKDIEKNQKLSPIFVVNTFTGTPDGKLIKAAAGLKYSHALISLNSKLSPMYSFDEALIPDPKDPEKKTMYKGLVVDNFERYKRDLSFGDLRVIVIMVTQSTKKKIEEAIKYYLDRIDKTKYSYKKLIGHIVGSKEMNSFGDMAMVCSEFVDTVLKYANIDISGKSSSNTKPDDLSKFHDRNNFFQVFEGKVSQYNPKKIDNMIDNLKNNTEYKNLKSQTKNSMKNPYDHELGRENLIPGMAKRGGKAIANKAGRIKKRVLKEDGTFEWIEYSESFKDGR